MPAGRLTKDNPLEVPLGDCFTLETHLEAIQRHYLQRAMREAAGVKSQAARLLGMQNYQTLDAQLKRLDVEWDVGDDGYVMRDNSTRGMNIAYVWNVPSNAGRPAHNL